MSKANVTITITIASAPPPPPPPLKIDTSQVPAMGTVGTEFAGEISVSGGNPPDTLSGPLPPSNPPAGATPGLPPGLSLNDSTGEITGAPTTAGVFSFDVAAADSNG